MYSPYNLPIISPPRSTPSLEADILEYEYLSPADEFLSTPDLVEWRETQRLEYEKVNKSAGDSQVLDLPVLGAFKQRHVVSELSDTLPTWPYTTISPEDAFPDYAEVCQYLERQAHPSSPSSEYELSETDDAPVPCSNGGHVPETRPQTPTPPPSSVRRIGKKAKREEDDWDDHKPAPKRQMLHLVSPPDLDTDAESDDDRDQGDDDGSGNFQPSRRPAKQPRVLVGSYKCRRAKAPRRPTVSKPKASPKRKSNRGEDYQEGPCDCRAKGCPHCQMTCFYPFAHGQRKGEICRRLFESGRHLDLKRHKATHAVQEWKWLEDGEISAEEAHWHLVVFEGKEHGLICPNGDCATTFTRYDALKRHMERGTCQWIHLESGRDDLDNRQLKAKVIQESNEKYERLTEAKKHA